MWPILKGFSMIDEFALFQFLFSSQSGVSGLVALLFCISLCTTRRIMQGFWLSYSLCGQFNLYSSDRSLCPLCLCGLFRT